MPKGLMVAIAVLVLMMVIVPGQATTTAFDITAASNGGVASHGIAPTANGILAAFASARAATPEPVSLMVAGSALIALGLALKRAHKSV